MMRRRILLVAILAALAVAAFLLLRPRLYGNDAPSMEKLIARELRTKESVAVFASEDLGDSRIAGYLLGQTQCGFARFVKNAKGNYRLEEVKKPSSMAQRAADISVAYFTLDNQDKKGGSTFCMAVASNNPDLARIDWVDLDSGEKREIRVEANPSITVIEYPQENQRAEYRFYDAGGQPIA